MQPDIDYLAMSVVDPNYFMIGYFRIVCTAWPTVTPAPRQAGAGCTTDAYGLVHQVRGQIDEFNDVLLWQSQKNRYFVTLLTPCVLNALAQLGIGLLAFVETVVAFTAPVIAVVRNAAMFPGWFCACVADKLRQSIGQVVPGA